MMDERDHPSPLVPVGDRSLLVAASQPFPRPLDGRPDCLYVEAEFTILEPPKELTFSKERPDVVAVD